MCRPPAPAHALWHLVRSSLRPIRRRPARSRTGVHSEVLPPCPAVPWLSATAWRRRPPMWRRGSSWARPRGARPEPVGPAACEALAPGSLAGGCCRPRCPPPHRPPLPIPACGDPRSFRLPIATSPLCASVGARGGRPVPRRLRAEAEGLRVEVQASGPTGADVGGGRGGPPRASVGRGGRGGPGQRWREVPAACRVAS